MRRQLKNFTFIEILKQLETGLNENEKIFVEKIRNEKCAQIRKFEVKYSHRFNNLKDRFTKNRNAERQRVNDFGEFGPCNLSSIVFARLLKKKKN